MILNDINFNMMVSSLANDLIINNIWDNEQITIAGLILQISDIAYNNTTNEVLPLDDGMYDQLIVLYKKYNPQYQTGAKPSNILEVPQNEIEDKKIMCSIIPTDKFKDNLFMEDIWNQNTPRNVKVPKLMCYINDRSPITKRLINTQHKYPELVGTLDKCKFVLNADAKTKNVFDNPAIQIFERDYIFKCLNLGVIQPNEVFEMVGELKYDGISIEAEVCGDTIISALSRGDTADNIATDFSPILSGFRFLNAKDVPKDVTFGIKFEAIITWRNLDKLSEERGKAYKNCRNAIIGLFGASDAYKYVDYITLIPLSCSLEMSRAAELEFLNKYYNSGEYNRYVFMRGNYQEILFQVKQFADAAEEIRNVLPYMIDGVVISFTDPNKIAMLGREASVNKYQMAIKFNPKKVRTIFIGYTYNIGKSGEVIPMAHFKPCEFIGTIHTKQTIHSYSRFNELNLAIGEQIDIEYVNDVLTYITKPDTEFNRNLIKEPEKFIGSCPFCGSKIEISQTGKSARCPNINCHERQIMRMVDMLDRLGFKDIAEESVRLINITSLNQLLYNTDINDVSILGPLTSQQFIGYIEYIKNNPIPDYRIMSALGFEGMADEKWKLIFRSYTLKELLDMNTEQIISNLSAIKGIGLKIAQAVNDGMHNYINDILCINNLNIIDSKYIEKKPKVAFTGFRDKEFIQLLINNGFDADEKYTVTKDTFALIANDINSNSTKIETARKYAIPVFNRDEFINKYNINL